MGRQIGFYALADDLGEFLQVACSKTPVIVTLMDSDRADIEPLADPRSERRTMTLWNQALIPTLERELVHRQASPDYYRISYSLPVLELSPSLLASWNTQPALLRGRLYGSSFEGAPKDYAAWYGSLARWMRSHFARSPLDDGYIGRAALAWFKRGGILLPGFVPPVSPEWESYVEAQRTTRARFDDEAVMGARQLGRGTDRS